MKTILLITSLIALIVLYMATPSSQAIAKGEYHIFLPVVRYPLSLPPSPPLESIQGIASIYDDGQIDIYTLRADGSEQPNLTNTPTLHEYLLAWSPDGSKVFYSVKDEEGYFTLWLMNADGSVPQMITPTVFPPTEITWNLQGDIAYSTDSDIILIQAGTTVAMPLPLPISVIDPTIEWSPDGTRLGFSADLGDGTEVYHVARDGTDLQRVTTNDSSIFDTFGGWAENGAAIVVSRYVNANDQGLWLVVADGNSETRITPPDEIAQGVERIAPDGRRMLYQEWGVVQDVPTLRPHMAVREIGTPGRSSYEALASCRSDYCDIRRGTWSTDSNIVAWEMNGDASVSSPVVFYAIAPFTTLQYTDADSATPSLVGSLLFYTDHATSGLEQASIKAVDISSGTSYDITLPGDYDHILNHEWRYSPMLP